MHSVFSIESKMTKASFYFQKQIVLPVLSQYLIHFKADVKFQRKKSSKKSYYLPTLAFKGVT